LPGKQFAKDDGSAALRGAGGRHRADVPVRQDDSVEAGEAEARARQRELVQRGYDAISLAYRSDDAQAAPSSAEDVRRYAGWAVRRFSG
jgi:hypothetical protein